MRCKYLCGPQGPIKKPTIRLDDQPRRRGRKLWQVTNTILLHPLFGGFHPRSQGGRLVFLRQLRSFENTMRTRGPVQVVCSLNTN